MVGLGEAAKASGLRLAQKGGTWCRGGGRGGGGERGVRRGSVAKPMGSRVLVHPERCHTQHSQEVHANVGVY